MTTRRTDVYVDARLVAYRRGGIARYASELCSWLPRIAPDLSIQGLINRPTTLASVGTARVLTPPHFRFERTTLGIEMSLRLPKLFHSTDFIVPSTVGIKRVATVHDLSFYTHPANLTEDSTRYYRQIERSIDVADRVIAVSRYTADLLVERTSIDREKVVMIHNGVSNSRPVPSVEEAQATLGRNIDEKTESLLRGSRPIILSVGTIEPRKRHQLLLRALQCPELRQNAAGPVLVLVGQAGWSCDEIITEIQSATDAGRAVWLDSADDELLDALYRTATALVMPSLDEGFGLPILEAMRSGLPVVAANRGALPEIAGDAAILMDDDEPEAWAATLSRLIENPAQRAEMSTRGISRAGQFTWERTARQTADVYREVLDQ